VERLPFVGWLIRSLVVRPPDESDGAQPADARLGLFLAVGSGAGGVAGFLVWIYEHFELI
jgi:hypothetical protein